MERNRILDKFIKLLQTYHPFNTDAEEAILPKLSIEMVDKGHFLVVSGKSCSNLWLIHNGVVRSFVEMENRQINTWIAREHQFITAFSQWGRLDPVSENIQALALCRFVKIAFDDLDNCCRDHPEIGLAVMKMLAQWCGQVEQRAQMVRLSNACAKYAIFSKIHSDLLNRITLIDVAQYLGIRPETLSRVRAQYGRKGNEKVRC